MGVWDSYENRVATHGSTKREASLLREQHMLNTKLPDSLSYHIVTIDNVKGFEIAIVSSDNLNEKNIYSTNIGSIKSGMIVEWMDNFWLITESDANTEVYTKAKMRQCNHLLKWINTDGKICEQWCIVEDGTKYLTGEYEDRNFVVTRGDSRIALTIGKNKETVKLNRENRFLIDDPDSTKKLSYQLTKPLKIGLTYGDNGVYSFVLQEVVSTNDDNHELGIADYYKYFPREPSQDIEFDNTSVINPDNTSNDEGKKVWL